MATQNTNLGVIYKDAVLVTLTIALSMIWQNIGLTKNPLGWIVFTIVNMTFIILTLAIMDQFFISKI